MKKKTKSRLSDVLFITVCLLICGLSLYYFFTDLNRSMSRNDRSIALIYLKRKITQRKFSDSVVWDRLQNGSLLYNEDIIRTDMDSVAIMDFTSHVKVELDENTMIQIFEDDEGALKFRVSGGNFTIDTSESAQKVKIDLGASSVIELDAGSKMSALSDGGKNSFVIHEGTGSIVSNDGTAEYIKSGESVKMDASGKKQVLPVSVANLDSNEKFLSFDDDEKIIDFKFALSDAGSSSEDENKKIILETSSDKDFKNIIEKIEVKDKNEAEVKAKDGKLYYRVYLEDKIEEAYEGKIAVTSVKEPSLLSPADKSIYSSVDVLPKINFKWDVDEYCDFSRLEIYDKNDIKHPVVSKDVAGHSALITDLNAGNFFWKITPHYAIDDIGFGEPTASYDFKIFKEDINVNPVASLPRDQSDFYLTKKENQVLFLWTSDVKESDYKLTLSKSDSFGASDIIYSSQLEQTQTTLPFSIDTLPEGKYFWYVTRIDEAKKEYNSEVSSFSVHEYIPQKTDSVFPPDGYRVESKRLSTVQFIWRLGDEIKNKNISNVIELSRDENFTQIAGEIRTDYTSYTGIKLAEGNYYWRVKAFDKDNSLMLDNTSVKNIYVIKELAKPFITVPRDNSVHNMSDVKSIKIAWNPVNEADYYKVKIYDLNDKLLSESGDVKKQSVDLLVPGAEPARTLKYKCTVQAFSTEKAKEPSRASAVSECMFMVENARRVALTSPQDNTVFDGLNVLRNPVSFTWNEDSTSKKTQFILTKINSNGTSTVVSRIDNPRNRLTFKRLSAGSYRWTVKATSVNGTDLSPEKNYAFTITSIEQLATAKLLSPENSLLIGPEFLKNTRKILFSWDDVEGATDYVFALYKKNENGTLTRVMQKKSKSTLYWFTDFSILDVGEFEWHVTAYAHARDGFEERRSETAVNRFTISFDLPDTVKTKDPGRMYGE
ncbi:hypothetical protein [Treponema sp.]|uniref:hypothetical protein n=1 Tax=Treponema sp. TaxID=166 RepID=UPI00298E0022|nr:hypothetical protein [Treponema sp.]